LTEPAWRGSSLRTRSPATTLAELWPALNEVGITRLANVTGLDSIGIPVVMAVRPLSRSLTVAQGKGSSLEAASASALMECFELHCAERHNLELRLSTERDLADAGIAYETDFAMPVDANTSDRMPILWTAAHAVRSALHQADAGGSPGAQPTLVPYELVHMDRREPSPFGSPRFLLSSNGLCSGNTVPEALLHGMCEVVERDASALFHALGDAAKDDRRLDLDTVDDPACNDMLKQFEAAGVGVIVWNETNDLGIAVFQCVIVDRDPNPFRYLVPGRGYGAHPDRGIALLRALAEAAQSRLTFISGARDDLFHDEYLAQNSSGRIDRYRADLVQPTPTCFHDVPTTHFDQIGDAVQFVDGQITQVTGSPPLYCDLSLPEIPAAVVRVLAPGLEGVHDIPRYSPGRRALAVTP